LTNYSGDGVTAKC